MRIGTGVQLPLTPPPSTSGIAPAATPDRSILLRAAALAASSPWPGLGNASGDDGPGNTPAPLPLLAVAPLPAVGLPAAPPAVLSSTTSLLASLQDASLPAAKGLPMPIPAAMSGALTAAFADRLSLSPATASLRTGSATQASDKPAVELTLNLLSALTGEPRSRLQLLAFGTPTPGNPDAVAGLAAKGANELLQLLVRGTVHGADGKQLDLTLGMSLQRQAAASVLDASMLDAIRSTLEQLARSEIKLDYPGASAALAGHSARFQAVLDPLGLWPMQSFLLSGLLILGQAWDGDEVAELDEEEDAAPSRDTDTDEQDPTSEQQQPKREAQALALDEPTPLPADGGLPIISANRWLELELRHWRSQLRLWMALPAEESPAA